MNQESAWRIIQTAFRCSAELQDLLRFLKKNVDAKDYDSFRLAIAAAIDGINVQLIDKAISTRPELADKIEAELKASGRIV